MAAFFDLEVYFEEEITRIEKQGLRLQKTVSLGDKKEEKTLTDYNLSDELAFFLDANINRTAWLDLYAVDSVVVKGNLMSLHYAAKEDKLKIKEVNIDFIDKAVSSIEVTKRNPTIIAEAAQILKYQPNVGYSIEDRQTVRLGKPQDLKIQVAFLP